MSKAVTLPNIRKLFIPDTSFTIYDCDLAGADAQVVAWEAEDEDLKQAFREGLDVHSKNAEDLFGTEFTSLTGPARDKKRKQTKVAVHLTNYGGSARTLAISQGWTTHQAELFQKRWFSIHPQIKKNFHGKVEAALQRNKTITNRFGYRRIFFDRADSIFGEALAWIPQSSVAEVSIRGALQIETQLSAQILLQVHDSIVFQIPSYQKPTMKEIRACLENPIPYDDPLTIPWGVAVSSKSWGDCENMG